MQDARKMAEEGAKAMENEKIAVFHDLLKESDNIVFFGGAGVSTE